MPSCAHSNRAIEPSVTSAGADDPISRAAAAHRVVFADFFGAWCGPCRVMDQSWADPGVTGLLDPAAGTVIKVDADQHVELAGRFDIVALPTTVAVVDGREVDRLTGSASPAALAAFIRSVQSNTPARDRLIRIIADARAAGNSDVRVRAQQELLGVLAREGDADAQLALLGELWLESDPRLLTTAHRATYALKRRGVDLAPLTPAFNQIEARARTGNAKARGAWSQLAAASGRTQLIADVLLGPDGASAKGVAENAWLYTVAPRLAADGHGRALLKLVDLSSRNVNSWAEFYAGDDRSSFTPWQRAQAESTQADDVRTLAVLHAACLAQDRSADGAAVVRWMYIRFPRAEVDGAIAAAKAAREPVSSPTAPGPPPPATPR